MKILFFASLAIIILLVGCGTTKASPQTAPLDVREEVQWDNPTSSEIEARLDKLEARIHELEKKTSGGKPFSGESLGPYEQFKGGSLEQRIERLEEKLGIR